MATAQADRDWRQGQPMPTANSLSVLSAHDRSLAIFRQADVSKSGKLDRLIIIRILQVLVPQWSSRHVDVMLDKCSCLSGSGLVDYEKLVSWIFERTPSANATPSSSKAANTTMKMKGDVSTSCGSTTIPSRSPDSSPLGRAGAAMMGSTASLTQKLAHSSSAATLKGAAPRSKGESEKAGLIPSLSAGALRSHEPARSVQANAAVEGTSMAADARNQRPPAECETTQVDFRAKVLKDALAGKKDGAQTMLSQAQASPLVAISNKDRVRREDFARYAQAVAEKVARGHASVKQEVLGFLEDQSKSIQEHVIIMSNFSTFECSKTTAAGVVREHIVVDVRISRAGDMLDVAYKSTCTSRAPSPAVTETGDVWNLGGSGPMVMRPGTASTVDDVVLDEPRVEEIDGQKGAGRGSGYRRGRYRNSDPGNFNDSPGKAEGALASTDDATLQSSGKSRGKGKGNGRGRGFVPPPPIAPADLVPSQTLRPPMEDDEDEIPKAVPAATRKKVASDEFQKEPEKDLRKQVASDEFQKELAPSPSPLPRMQPDESDHGAPQRAAVPRRDSDDQMESHPVTHSQLSRRRRTDDEPSAGQYCPRQEPSAPTWLRAREAEQDRRITAAQFAVTLDNMARAWLRAPLEQRPGRGLASAAYAKKEPFFDEDVSKRCLEIVQRWHSGSSSHPDCVSLARTYSCGEDGANRLLRHLQRLRGHRLVEEAEQRLWDAMYAVAQSSDMSPKRPHFAGETSSPFVRSAHDGCRSVAPGNSDVAFNTIDRAFERMIHDLDCAW